MRRLLAWLVPDHALTLPHGRSDLSAGLRVLYGHIATQAGALNPDAVVQRALTDMRGANINPNSARRLLQRITELSR